MNNINELLEFIGNVTVLERDERSVIIKKDDMCLRYQPNAGCGQHGRANDIDIFDYEDYLEERAAKK